MASGFIKLRNGSAWSHRWSGYDLVLEMIMDELSADGDERNSDHEMVARNLDTRFMKDKYLQIFWNALKRVRHKTIGEIDSGYVGGF